jgi:hypothetical protein
MAKLYVANLGAQPHDFHYRMPAEEGWSRRVQVQTIAPGTQQQVHAETSYQVLEAIIDQHRQYGMIDANEVHKTPGFVGLCYSIDRPVNFDLLSLAVDHNKGALYDIGKQNRENAARDIDRAFESTLTEAINHGEIRGSAIVKAIHIDNLEDTDAPTFAERVTVDHQMPMGTGGLRRA